MAITAGTYKARADGECVLGASRDKGTPFIEFYLKILDGENKGGLVRWTGYFTEKTSERSISALQTCGWTGDDLSEFADGKLHGLDKNEVSIVVEIETYQNQEGEERSSPRVAWINRAGGYLNKEAAMNEQAAAAFGARMRGLVLKGREKMPLAKTTGQAPPAAPATNASGEDSDPIPF